MSDEEHTQDTVNSSQEQAYRLEQERLRLYQELVKLLGIFAAAVLSLGGTNFL